MHVSGGDLTLSGWAVATAKKVVILVDGNVVINSAVTGIDTTGGGTLVVMAGGNITINSTVGVAGPVDLAALATGHVQGVYFAQGTFDTGLSTANQLRIDGVAVGMTSVSLQRNVASDSFAAEYFNFVPAMVINMPQGLLRKNIRQSLVNP